MFVRPGAANDLGAGSVVKTFQPPAMHFKAPPHFKRPRPAFAMRSDEAIAGEGGQVIHRLLKNRPGKQLVATALGAFAARPHGRLAVKARAGESFQFVDHFSSWSKVLTDQAHSRASAQRMTNAISD